jgi:hypothetical protein
MATATAAAPTTTDPTTPPRMEIVTKSETDMARVPNAMATMCAAGPRKRQVASVRYQELWTFWPRNPRRRREGSN